MDQADIDEMIEAQKHLAGIDAFRRLGSERDAGPLLNPFIGLDSLDFGPQQTTWWNDLSEEQIRALNRTEAGRACRCSAWQELNRVGGFNGKPSLP
jgi:hypothetical protein